MRRMMYISPLLMERNCPEARWRNGSLARIIQMADFNHKDVTKNFGMLSAAADGAESRLTRDLIVSVAAMVAGSHEILLFPMEWGKNQDDRRSIKYGDTSNLTQVPFRGFRGRLSKGGAV